MAFPKTALILAGGKGTRLRPITYEIPKALIPIHGKTLTEHLFDLFKRHNVNDIILAVGHLKERVMAHFGAGEKYNVKINYIQENEPLGTAGPLKMAKDKIKDTIFVSNGDEVKDVDLEKMYEMHKKSNALLTIALTKVKDPSAYGVARMDGNQILEFIEKPKENAPSHLINSGLYLIEPEVLNMIPEGFSMLEKDIFPKLAKSGKLYGFYFPGQWFDTGNMERYEQALKEWKDLV